MPHPNPNPNPNPNPDQAATQQLCALCAALDRAPPLEFPHARLSVREWLA